MKAMFANTINELGNNAALIANECEKYGMTWGCNEDCPVLNRNECGIYSNVDEYLEEQENEEV